MALAEPIILVVDDDADLRAYVRQCLSAFRYRSIEAADGAEALDVLTSIPTRRIALVVADVNMPRMDGRALKAAMAADSRLAHIPVLLMTGDAVRSRDGPVLRKPFNALVLASATSPLVGR